MTKSQRTILLVDDGTEDRLTIRRYLGMDPDYDYTIWDATSAEEGLTLYQRVHPDCLIVNSKLPDADGGVFLRRLYEQEEFMSCGVIVLSSNDNDAVIVDSMRSGAHDYLVKRHMNAPHIWAAITQAISKATLKHGIELQHQRVLKKNQELEQKNRDFEQAAEYLLRKKDELEELIQRRTTELNTAQTTLHMQALVLQHMIEGVGVVDEFSNFVFVNLALERMCGYSPGELLGQNMSILHAEESTEKGKMRRIIIDHLTHVGEWRGEIPNRTKTGDQIISSVRASKLQISGKNYFVMVQENITERRRIEKALQERERLADIGSTSIRLTHEIGNRLNGISTSLQILERHFAKQAVPREALVSEVMNDMKEETLRLTGVLQDLRSLAIPHHLHLQTINLLEVMQDCLQAQEQKFSLAGILIKMIISDPAIFVQADREGLWQIFRNLFQNAMEAMPQGGTLTITTFVDPQNVRVEIQDTGVGVPQDVNIWEPFITTKPGGSGLGLTVAKLLVAVLNGTLSYISPEGQGTTFILKLPSAASMSEKDTSLSVTETSTPKQSSSEHPQNRKASR